MIRLTMTVVLMIAAAGICYGEIPVVNGGDGVDKTYNGQGTYILTDGEYITFMADIWNPKSLPESEHLWLPITFDEDGIPAIYNQPE